MQGDCHIPDVVEEQKPDVVEEQKPDFGVEAEN